MTQYKNVFSPFKVGNTILKNRIETSPMLPSLASPDGFVTREMIDFYQSFARGGAAIVTVGDAAVDFEYAMGHYGQLNLGDDRIVGGLHAMADAIQRFGAKLSIELDHQGRIASQKVLKGVSPIGPSPVPALMEELGARAQGRDPIPVKEMDQSMIDHVVNNFAEAAFRCMEAGLEIIMVHGGHGQLISQFVSPYSNKRTDRYGGTLNNRARFAIEVLDAIRRKVGDRLALEYRVSGAELVEGGMDEEETIEFIRMIQDRIDMVNVSLGGVADPRVIPYMAQPTYFPHGFNVHRAEKMRRAVRIPVSTVGSIMSIEMADRIIAEGKADMVLMARAQVADPEIVNKSRRGELGDIRPCVRCNTCGEKAMVFLPVRCAINPVTGRETEFKQVRPPEKKKMVVVIGGGPAGIQAAITASHRGHDVTLFEKDKELGGALRLASSPSFKGDMKRYMEWLINKLMKSPADIRLASKADPIEIASMRPDVIIIAIGADPVIPELKGIDKKKVVLAGDVDSGKAETGKRVVVAGAGLTGCETALHILEQDKEVTVIDMAGESEIMKDAALVSRIWIQELLGHKNAEIRTGLKLEEITDEGVLVSDRVSGRYEIPADTVVLSLGMKSREEEASMFEGLAPDVYMIGDCKRPGNLMAAVHQAFFTAVEI